MTRFVMLAVVAMMLVVPTVAQGAVVETASSRYVLAYANGGSDIDGPHQTFGPEVYGFFDEELFADASDSGNFGQGLAIQTSTISNGLYEVYLDTYANATGTFFDLADGTAEAHFEVSFTLTSSEDFMITGAYGGAFGAINGEVSQTEIVIENVGVGGSPTQVILFEDNDYPSINVSGTLLPGDYKFSANSLSGVQRVFEDSFGDANAGTNFTMTITPEPSSLAFLAMGGLVMWRRRRR